MPSERPGQAVRIGRGPGRRSPAVPGRRDHPGPPVGSIERTVRWCRRNPSVAGLLATSSLVLGSGLAVVTGSIFRPTGSAETSSSDLKWVEVLAATESALYQPREPCVSRMYGQRSSTADGFSTRATRFGGVGSGTTAGPGAPGIVQPGRLRRPCVGRQESSPRCAVGRRLQSRWPTDCRGRGDGTISLWDGATGRARSFGAIREGPLPGIQPRRAASSRGGRQDSPDLGRRVRPRVDGSSGTFRTRDQRGISPIGDQVVSSAFNNIIFVKGFEIKQWDLATGREIRTFHHDRGGMLGGLQPRRPAHRDFGVLGWKGSRLGCHNGQRSHRCLRSGGSECGPGLQPGRWPDLRPAIKITRSASGIRRADDRFYFRGHSGESSTWP